MSEKNTATILLTVPQNDNLNCKAHDVNSRLTNMCGHWGITFTDHNFTINTERHLSENKIHLNKAGVTEFYKNVCEFSSKQD